MQNPFRPSTEAELPAPSTRGASFRIKSGDQVFEGRPVNAPWVKHTILAMLEPFAKESARIMHTNFDSFERRLSHLETELGVTSHKDVGSFRSVRLGDEDV